MTVVTHPLPGTIIRVDLSDGFRPPEMGKRRPAVILSPALVGRPKLCAIIPLSTTEPRIQQAWHHRIELDPPLPHPYNKAVMWAKCDMIQTVAFHRLRLLFDGKDAAGQRIYDVRVLDALHMDAIRNCVKAGLGL